MTEELLHLLWVLEATLELYPELERNLGDLIAGELFAAAELPKPTDQERQPPGVDEEEAPIPTQAELAF